MTTLCNATTLKGTKCRRTAGWGTNHLGNGRCRNHDGTKEAEPMKQSWLTFANEYLLRGNATAAYQKAYPNAEEGTAGVGGHELLKNPKISAYISQRWQENAASVDELINLQTNIARADMGDFLSVSPDGAVYNINLSGIKKSGASKLIKKIKHTQRRIKSKDGETETIDTYELELLDPQKAQVDLLKLHGKFNHTIKVETWRDKVIDALRNGRITPDDVLARFPDDIASEFFKQAGVNIDS